MGKKNTAKYRIIIAGGGTGGHIFTGVAVAEAFVKNNLVEEILFVGTKYGLEKKIIPSLGYNIKYVLVRGLKGKSILTTIRNLLVLPIGLLQSWLVLRKFKPDFVIGVGGYASGPVGIVAAKMKIMLGIIEQNSVPGITNKILSGYADFAVIAYKKAEKFLKCETHLTGIPLRQSIRGVAKKDSKSGKIVLLILGGSQGASSINRLITESIDVFSKYNKNISIVHQTGKADHKEVKEAYKNSGISDYKVIEFIEDMNSVYKLADFVITRSGAITTAEIVEYRLPAIYIPLPNSIYNHQYHNASEIVENGGGLLYNEKKDSIDDFKQSIEFMLNRKNLNKMMKSVFELKGENSAEMFVNVVLKQYEEKRRGS